MNQSKRVMYKDDFENFVMKDYEDLWLVTINIFPHVDLNNRIIIEEVMEISDYLPLVLLPNDSFIRISNKVEYFGEYYFNSKGYELKLLKNNSF